MSARLKTPRWSALTPTRWFGPHVGKRVAVNALHLPAIRLEPRRPRRGRCSQRDEGVAFPFSTPIQRAGTSRSTFLTDAGWKPALLP